MEKNHTSKILMVMIGLLAGRLISLQSMEVAELTGLFFLIVINGNEIWEALKNFAAKPAVRTYVAPRAAQGPRPAQGQGLVISASLLKKLVLLAGLVFGGLMLILDAIHRHP